MGGMTAGGGIREEGRALRAYPAYCDSGVEWLGDVPVGWRVVPAKALFGRVKELNTGMGCVNRLALTMGGVVHRSIDELEGLQASSFDTYQIFEKGDLAFKLIDLENESTSRVGLVPERGIMSPAYIRLAPRNGAVCVEYYHWFFMHLYWRRVFNALGGGVRQSLGASELLCLEVALPPIAEQRGIVDYLDRETGRIDGLIGKKERLIGLLRERRGALISQVVTKGLDSGARMKDSGVEWLGEVPVEWEEIRFKNTVVDFRNGVWGDEPDGQMDIACVRVADFKRDSLRINMDDLTVRAIDERERAGRILRKDDLLLEKSGGGETQPVGAVMLYDHSYPAVCSNFIAKMEIAPDFDANFLAYLHFAAYTARLNTRSIKQSTGIQNLNSSQYLSEKICVPPLAEQREIAAYLDGETGKIDALIGKVEGAIALLREYRAALISAAVTGKIDVREREAA